ncbi:MAG TPA: methyltransferase domain-containing protein [Bryobacteraceae bacterium]|nr:methyltransferase domain-containing protein [Bryobacteraceae bacterium]
MRVEEWDARYRAREREEDFVERPSSLVVSALGSVTPGRVLDLACGTGRNAIWLAQHGWRVTAVDGSQAAITALLARAAREGVAVETRVADLGSGEFQVEPNAWDAILDCYYLQRDLFPGIRNGVRPEGLALAIVHIVEPGEAPSYKNAARGELRGFFEDWEILHYYEGAPADEAHRRAVAQIVARRPLATAKR